MSVCPIGRISDDGVEAAFPFRCRRDGGSAAFSFLFRVAVAAVQRHAGHGVVTGGRGFLQFAGGGPCAGRFGGIPPCQSKTLMRYCSLLVEQVHLRLPVEISGPMSELPHLTLSPRSGRARSCEKRRGSTALPGFAFQDLEQQGELGDLDGLRVNVHAEDVVQENPFALGDGELPAPAGSLDDGRGCRLWPTWPDRSPRRTCRCQSSRCWYAPMRNEPEPHAGSRMRSLETRPRMEAELRGESVSRFPSPRPSPVGRGESYPALDWNRTPGVYRNSSRLFPGEKVRVRG